MKQKLLARLGRMQQIAALRHRGFRLLWTATVLSSTARWADMVVVGWLTLELTDSPLMVGIVARSYCAPCRLFYAFQSTRLREKRCIYIP